MRRHAVLALTVGLLAFGPLQAVPDRPEKKNPVKEDTDKLQGNWVAVAYELHGRPVSDEMVQRLAMRLTIRKNTWTLHRRDRDFPMTFRINPTARPKTVDLTIGYGRYQGKSVLAIYELAGDTLKICQAPVGRERPTAFASKISPPIQVMVFQRQKR